MLENSSVCSSTMYIEAPIDLIWKYLSTPSGWNSYLSDIAVSSDSSESFIVGEMIEMIIGELTNHAVCTEVCKPYRLSLDDHFIAIFPDGEKWEYSLSTTFLLEPIENMVKVSVIVKGFTDDEMLQWVRESTEIGWKQSLFNLKCILELGLDLRYQIFGYPRIGVFNYTATVQQRNAAGLGAVEGNYLKEVFPNGPAALAGLENGDIITHINRMPVPNYHELVKMLSSFYGRSTPEIQVTYWRRGRELMAQLLLTNDDRFTGLIDPNVTSLEEVARERRVRNI